VGQTLVLLARHAEIAGTPWIDADQVELVAQAASFQGGDEARIGLRGLLDHHELFGRDHRPDVGQEFDLGDLAGDQIDQSLEDARLAPLVDVEPGTARHRSARDMRAHDLLGRLLQVDRFEHEVRARLEGGTDDGGGRLDLLARQWVKRMVGQRFHAGRQGILES
jgi:hypothetical protein